VKTTPLLYLLLAVTAAMLGAAALLAAMLSTSHSLLNAQSVTFAKMLFLLNSVGGVAVLFLSLTWATCAALYAQRSRGPGYVGWVTPADCRNLEDWASFGWDYQSKERHRGFRFLGLEVAQQGEPR
jgi:hypothetical protein